MGGSADLLLALNAGSSSLKFELFGGATLETRLARGAVVGIGSGQVTLRTDSGHGEALPAVDGPERAAEAVLDRLASGLLGAELKAERLALVAHRIVHGGAEFSGPALISDDVARRLRALGELAPLHNPFALAVADVAQRRFPGTPMVAVFDTAFFRTLPEEAKAYAVPNEWRAAYGIERYGFHGIAHEYLTARVAARSEHAARIVTLQLGHGCSVAASRNGRPVETSMGFTPLEGLVMSTRCGDIDAGIVLHLARKGWPWQDIEQALSQESGLLGLSAQSDDMQELLAREAQGHDGARRAIAAFCHRAGKYLGAYVAVLGGIDAIAFGGGIGENSHAVRARVSKYLRFMGLEIDEQANAEASGSEARISTAGSPVEAYCIPVKEEAVIAQKAANYWRSLHDVRPEHAPNAAEPER
jgi:acetate kinase